jgi:uncharacterized BrkB/YihY/UPF0761 family membrane protein
LLFFFVLALGILLGAEFNAAIEQYKPAAPRKPRVLNPKDWRRLPAAEGRELPRDDRPDDQDVAS